MNGKMILLIEDNNDVQNFNKFLLEEQGFAVETAMTLAAARTITARRMPDAIVLDIGMPDGSGLDFLREFRKVSKIPVLLLTGYKKDDDVVRGFESGCNDYLTKPYTFAVLLVRLKNLLQSAEQVPDRLTYGPLTLDLIALRAYLNGEDMQLAGKEFALLSLLVGRKGETLSKEYLYEKAWSQPMAGDGNAVRAQISLLKKKLEEKSGGKIILMSFRGEGYCLEIEP